MEKNIKDDLASSLADELNKEFKDEGTVAYFIGGENTPTDVSEWTSTGSSLLDLAISNRPYGGFPIGRIIEITGLEASGKSLLASNVIAETQKKGGVSVYIDTENAMSIEFLQAIGIDTKKMVYVQLDTVESIFSAIENIINKIRDSNKDKLVSIVVDSIAAATTEDEKSGDYDKDGWATGKAIIISKALRKITRLIGKERICLVFTNQLREKLGVMFGDKYTTSGGRAIAFHSSVRLRLKSIGQIKEKKSGLEQVVGIKTRAVVIKNRVGPPFRSADFEIYFDRGIDDYGSWISLLKDMNVIKRSNPGWKVIDQNGEEKKFTKNEEWAEILDNDENLKRYLYEMICDHVIMKYKSNPSIGLSPDDLTLDEGDIVDE